MVEVRCLSPPQPPDLSPSTLVFLDSIFATRIVQRGDGAIMVMKTVDKLPRRKKPRGFVCGVSHFQITSKLAIRNGVVCRSTCPCQTRDKTIKATLRQPTADRRGHARR
jgi:hypothetical protein